ncbi:hypothetical protein YZUL1_24 [Citrobacter phage YZU-L1]|nr:hypothetical protein YZUL1_24 [Citrobacter phage YZU-L1]
MNIVLPKTLDKKQYITPDDMECGKVYQFDYTLASPTNTGCIIAVDTRDNDVLTFNDYSDFMEWLDDQSTTNNGELTPYQLTIAIK